MVGRRLLALAALAGPLLAETKLHYWAEWRLINAGNVTLSWKPQGDQKAGDATLQLQSAGVVARLYRVQNEYRVQMRSPFCAVAAGMTIGEPSRQRETKVVYGPNLASFEERDITAEKQLAAESVAVPECVHDVIGGMMALRQMTLEPGQSATIPVSDGRKFAQVRVEAQEKEVVKTPAGTFKTTRYEVFLMNGVIYRRPGRLFVWLTDDDRKLPVQFRVRLQLLVGTITLQLTKEEKF